MTDETLIRPGEARDLPAVIALVRGLAEFEKLPGPDAAAEERFARDLGKRYEMLVAETAASDGSAAPDGTRTIIGYALYFYTYSTFLAQPSLYLEDLYVDPALRGRGIGERFMRRLAAEAETQGCGRFEWTVLDWNVRAQKFYKSLGAELLDDWRVCRVSGDGIKRLASAR